MNDSDLKHLLHAVRVGDLDPEEAIARLRDLPYRDLGHTTLDTHRELRQGYPEVVLCEGKTVEQAAETAELLGSPVERLVDVGVAGVHRLLAHRARLRSARVLIVVAGMEGALPSVVAGLVDKPVIAVPSSVGYGASFGGLAALLGMLTSCAGGVGVVNIDNGYGAACLAHLINRL